jgi:hypothetical protein
VEEKCVSISMPENAQTPVHADANTSAAGAMVLNRSSGVPSVTPHRISTTSHLNRAAWARLMCYHPDKQFSDMILKYIDEGVPIFYEGPNVSRICKNWNSSIDFKDHVNKTIRADIDLGRKSGPYTYPPVAHFVGSPMGAFEKKRSGKVRIIHDLSWPPGESVNFYISADNSSVHYISIDDAVRHVKSKGRGALMCKVDLKDAYKSIVVRPADWHLLGTTWASEDGILQYYIDHVLPFGLRSSARLFDYFASALEFCMSLRGVTCVSHYLDDFMSCGRINSQECASNLSTMLDTCEMLGIAVNYQKVLQPSTCMEFLGIIIDSVAMELRMSEERLDDVTNELKLWLSRKYGTKRQLLSLLGKLVFMCRVIRPGRIFLRRLFNLSARVKFLHHRVHLSIQASKDILWWHDMALRWNRKSLFYEDMCNLEFGHRRQRPGMRWYIRYPLVHGAIHRYREIVLNRMEGAVRNYRLMRHMGL